MKHARGLKLYTVYDIRKSLPHGLEPSHGPPQDKISEQSDQSLYFVKNEVKILEYHNNFVNWDFQKRD